MQVAITVVQCNAVVSRREKEKVWKRWRMEYGLAGQKWRAHVFVYAMQHNHDSDDDDDHGDGA